MQRALNKDKATRSRCGPTETPLTVLEHSNQEGLISFLIPPICGDFRMERLRYPHISFTTKTTVYVIFKTNPSIKKERQGTNATRAPFPQAPEHREVGLGAA